MTYKVRYLDSSAMRIVDAVVDAANEEAVHALMAARGCQVLSLQRQWLWPLPGRAKASPAGWGSGELALFCKELRSLVGAGLSVVEALEALAAQRNEQKSSAHGLARAGSSTDLNLYAQILLRLNSGKSLSMALRDVGGIPPLLIASVQSSERTSNLGDALASYLRYDELVNALRRRLVSAALYPTIVVGLGLVITVFLLWIVIPRFAALYGQMGPGVGGITKALLDFSKLLQGTPWLVPLGLVMLPALGWLLVGQGRWRTCLRWLLVQVPPLARQARHFELTRVFEALAMLTRGGFSFHEALEMCKSVALDEPARERLMQAQAHVSRGVSVARACAEAGLTDSVTERLLRASERGGDFAGVLQAISQRHAGAFETFIERATRVVEPVLLLAVAVLVGGMVVMLYMPIFDIASSIR